LLFVIGQLPTRLFGYSDYAKLITDLSDLLMDETVMTPASDVFALRFDEELLRQENCGQVFVYVFLLPIYILVGIRDWVCFTYTNFKRRLRGLPPLEPNRQHTHH
jgi:hypothetical protein